MFLDPMKEFNSRPKLDVARAKGLLCPYNGFVVYENCNAVVYGMAYNDITNNIHIQGINMYDDEEFWFDSTPIKYNDPFVTFTRNYADGATYKYYGSMQFNALVCRLKTKELTYHTKNTNILGFILGKATCTERSAEEVYFHVSSYAHLKTVCEYYDCEIPINDTLGKAIDEDPMLFRYKSFEVSPGNYLSIQLGIVVTDVSTGVSKVSFVTVLRDFGELFKYRRYMLQYPRKQINE